MSPVLTTQHKGPVIIYRRGGGGGGGAGLGGFWANTVKFSRSPL